MIHHPRAWVLNVDLALVNQGHLYSFVLVIQSLCLFRLFIQSRSSQGVIRFPYSNSNYFVGSLSPLGWFQRMVTPEYLCYTLILFGWSLGFFDSLRLLNQYLVGWSCSHAWYVIFDLADLHLGGDLGNLPECIPCYPQSRALLWVFFCPIVQFVPGVHPWTSKVFIPIQFVSRGTPMPCVDPKAWVVVASVVVGS